MEKLFMIIMTGAFITLAGCSNKEIALATATETTNIEVSDSAEELASTIVDFYTKEFAPEGNYVIFDEENIETDDEISFILRYQPSDAEEEEMIANGTGPVANKYVATVTYNKATGSITDENGLSIREELIYE